jgi:hypothetical protein
MRNLIGTIAVHATTPTNTQHWACRPNHFLADDFVEASRTDSPVTCGTCRRIIAEAERQAYDIAAELAQAVEEARNCVDFVDTNRTKWTDAELTREVNSDRAAIARYLAWGQVKTAADFTYVLTLAELELARRARIMNERSDRVADTLRTIVDGLAKAGRADTTTPNQRWTAMLDLEHGFALQLATAAGVHIVNEGEWTERQRRLERVAEGQRQAAAGRQDGERPPYPVDARDWLASSLSMLSIHERAAEHQQKLAKLLDTPGELDSMDFWALGMAAFDRQRNLDIIHARVIGQCPGCYRESVTQKFGHRASCPMYLMDGPLEMDTDDVREYWEQHSHGWSDEEVQRYWATVDPTR